MGDGGVGGRGVVVVGQKHIIGGEDIKTLNEFEQ